MACLHEPAQQVCSQGPRPCVRNVLLEVGARSHHRDAQNHPPGQSSERLQDGVVCRVQQEAQEGPVEFVCPAVKLLPSETSN